jgi:outer membrane protein OmpA-like peptidoglycan-associated protein
MKTVTRRRSALAVAGCMAAVTAYGGAAPQEPAAGSKPSDIGALSGIAIGAIAAGPVGAVVGGATGALLGDRYHRQTETSAALTAELKRSEGERAQLDQALSRSRAQGDELAAQIARTDQLGLDVNFRTADDSVAAQALSPLLKLGALAASLPQAQVSVAGFADPRGTERYNQELSQRRALNVAAVLTSAGVPRERIHIEAHGKQAAQQADGDLDGYALERRVTVRLQLLGTGEVARRD